MRGLAALRPARALLLLLACVGAGCALGPAARAPGRPPSEAVVAQLRARNAIRFAVADFLKPRADGAAPIDPYLAPLIHLEAPHDAPLGSVRAGDDGALRFDAGPPTVYFADRRVVLDGRERRQLSFVWFRRTSVPRAQGVRLTFDADGFPAIAEALDGGDGLRAAWVSESLERSAVRAFGGPLPGRAYALEADPRAGHALVVAGTVDRGPVPMGPFVYQGREGHRVVTIRCRCSPSQVDAIGQTVEYELAPLEALAGAWPAPGQARFASPEQLTRGLRLPPGM